MIPIMLLIANLSISCITNSSSLQGFMSCGNTDVNGFLGAGILFAIFLIATVGGALKGLDILATITAAGFLCTILGLLMSLLNPPLASILLAGVFGAVALVGTALMLTRGGSSVF